MSSRGSFVGSGPNAGAYRSRPTPANQEDLPVYLNDEFLDLGGKLNNIIEGGVFPPQSELPVRYKEGMTIFFTQAVKDSEITSSGVWLYKDKKWWKMINDPSALTQTLTVYTVTVKGAPSPNTPPRDKYLPEDLGIWKYVPSTSLEDTSQWVSVAALAHVGEDPDVDWSEPLIFNSQGDVGPPGDDGWSTEQRFLASSLQPAIRDKFERIPYTDKGVVFSKDMPQVSHPDENYIWVTVATVKGTEVFNEGWSEPSRYSTPDTTKAAVAYAKSKEEQYPTFNPDAEGMPGVDWTPSEPADLDKHWYLWRSDRLEWTDGYPQTSWTHPYQINSIQGAYVESRYITSTKDPVVSNPSGRDPVFESRPWVKNIPNVTHPDGSYVWIITGIVNRFEEMQQDWSEPAKFATPDTTQFAIAYAVGSKNVFPSFTPSSEELPGDDWSSTYPTKLNKGQYVWTTERLEWTSGLAQTPWSTPYRSAAVDSINFENRYKASTDKPTIVITEREPLGWTKHLPPVSHPNESYIWFTSATIDSVNDELVTNWQDPSKFATPDTTISRNMYAIGTIAAYPAFDPASDDTPGPAWSNEPPTKLNKGQYVWNTHRLEWSDGTKQTNWTTPFRSTAVDGVNFETRYTTSTGTPVVDTDNRNPPGWGLNITSVAHPNNSYVWAITAKIDTVNDTLIGLWSSPIKYSTPDTTMAGRAYAIGEKTAYPSFTPTSAGMPGSAWSSTPPAPVPVGKFVWYSERLQWADGTKQTNWTTPIRITGEDGTSGTSGVDGKPGAGYYTIINDSAAASWPSNASILFREYVSRDPIKGDALTFTNKAKSQTNSRMYTGSTWGAFDFVLNGSAVINGTLAAEKIVAGSISSVQIKANSISGDKITANTSIKAPILEGGIVKAVSFQGTNILGTGTISGGTISGTQFTNGSGFSVTPTGVLKATGATISGAITATSGSFTGAINATSGTFRGTVTGSRIEASSIGISSNFSVNTSGVLNAKGATISGAITATSGSFTGTVNATNGTFKGTISGSAINTSTITTGSGNFTVNSSGVMTCKSASVTGAITATSLTAQSVNTIGMTSTGTIIGGELQGSRLVGGNIYVPNKTSPNFRVESNGNMMCNNATINGKINNSTMTGGAIVGTSININNRFLVAGDGTTTIQSAPSGSRMIIKNDRIEVWEGNSLRVVLGRL